jgi:putative membrane protein
MMRNGIYAVDGLGRHMGLGGGIFMMIGVAILIGLLVYLFVTLIRSRQPNQTSANNTAQQDSSSALGILNERYARGEIDDEEYTRRKTELKK